MTDPMQRLAERIATDARGNIAALNEAITTVRAQIDTHASVPKADRDRMFGRFVFAVAHHCSDRAQVVAAIVRGFFATPAAERLPGLFRMLDKIRDGLTKSPPWQRAATVHVLAKEIGAALVARDATLHALALLRRYPEPDSQERLH